MKDLCERHGRAAALALLIGVLVFLGWQIVARTMARIEQFGAPEAALFWDPDCAAALLTLAESRLVAPEPPEAGETSQVALPQPSKADLAAARDLAERALRFDPLAPPRALTDLGRIAAIEGDKRRAAALMKLAGKRALRDAFAQAWLAEHALAKSDFAVALAHLDALLRTHPEERGKALPLLAAFVATPRAAAALAHLVGKNPPWRGWFLSALASRLANRAALTRFYTELIAGPHPPSERELQPYLERLIRDGEFEEAHAVWESTLPAGRRPQAATTLYNAHFQYPLSGSEFDWRIVHEWGADIEIVGGAGEARTLRIEFSGARVNFHNVRHLLLLAPGTYQLTGEVEAEALHSTRGLWWRVFCAGPKAASLGETDLVADSMPWRAFSLTFHVPAESCPAQMLQLELPARINLEKRIEGVVSYRKLAITALPGGDGESSASEGKP